jgi:hypothetical protein
MPIAEHGVGTQKLVAACSLDHSANGWQRMPHGVDRV